MSLERIGIEKALPMFLLGTGCILATAIVFGILCGNMIRARRKIEKIQRQNSITFPTSIINNNKIHNTNQSAASLSSMAIILDPTFKIHPHYPFSMKHIIEL